MSHISEAEKTTVILRDAVFISNVQTICELKTKK